MARFVGGPYDGKTLSPGEISSAAEILTFFTESGNRSFVLMPPSAECEQILKGEITKNAAGGSKSVYERVFTAAGVEFHEAGENGAFAQALASRDRPLSEQEQARKRMFGRYADRFSEEIRLADVTGTTEVAIAYRVIDQQGNVLPPLWTDITSNTKVLFPGHVEAAKSFAVGVLLDTFIGNVDSLVRNAPTGIVSFPQHPDKAVQIMGFELEIRQLATKSADSKEKRVVSFTIEAETPPLREDGSGAWRVGNSRVLVELVLRAFQDGATAETIVQRYPTLLLADVYAVIAYYLRHREEIEAYLAHREQLAQTIRQKIERGQKDLSDIRSRILARKTDARDADAALAQ